MLKRFQIRITELAQQNLDDISDYIYAVQQSPQNARLVKERLRSAI